MKHHNCGGRIVRVQNRYGKSVYQCNRCRKIIIVYSASNKTATSGNLVTGSKIKSGKAY